MRRVCTFEILLIFALCVVTGCLSPAIACGVVADSVAEAEPKFVPLNKRNPVFVSVYGFAEGGLWWQATSVKNPPPDYYLPFCNVGGALSIYSDRAFQYRLFAGYEYASLTKSSKWGRIDSHWFTADFNFKFNALMFGVRCQVLLSAMQQGVLPHEMAGMRTDCFNKVACNGYLGLSYYNVEVAMGFYFVPILNKKQVAKNTLDDRFLSPFTFSLRFNIPVFTTGRRKELFEMY